MVVFIVVAFLLICLSVDAVIQYKRRKEVAINKAASSLSTAFDVYKLVIPRGIYFSKTHTWAYMDKYGNVKMGINDFLQHITGHITGLKLKTKGDQVKKSELLMSIVQNGKQLNINSPLTGKIKAINKELENDSSIINSSPYNEGWVYEIEPSNWTKETKFMLMAEKASEWLKNEFIRFKDFLAIMQSKNIEYANIAMQDGGEIKDKVMSELGPEAWEEFQTKFIEKV